MRPVLSEAVHFISGRRKIKFMPPTEAKLHFSGGWLFRQEGKNKG